MLWLSTFPSPMTLTLDFQGQTLKMLYLRNGRADWHGTKGMWVDRMLNTLCDFQLWPKPWPWPWIFKVSFKKSHIRNGMTDWRGMKGMWVDSSGQTILLNDRSDRSKPLRSIIDRKANLRSIICTFFIIVKWMGLLLRKQYIIITVKLGIWDNSHLLW